MALNPPLDRIVAGTDATTDRSGDARRPQSVRRPDRRVVVVQRVLPHYRIDLFDALHERLAGDGIVLRVVFGQEQPGSVPRSVSETPPWATRIANLYLGRGGSAAVWQPCLAELRGAGLVIVEQSNRLLLNYGLMLARRLGRLKLAYWGHGRNFQSVNRGSGPERFKRSLARQADWWFAYTSLSAEAARDAGVDDASITTVNNAVDTRGLASGVAGVGAGEQGALRRRLGITGQNVALYCGGLSPQKQLGFLFESCLKIKSELSDFHLVIVGDGPSRHEVEAFARQHPWVHWAGPRFGVEKCPYFALARVLLMPGPVGLVIVDSFAAGRPLLTTRNGRHGPEIAYLENGENGLVTEESVEAYADGVLGVLRDPVVHEHLSDGCARSAVRYTLPAMVDRFAGGVVQCLDR